MPTILNYTAANNPFPSVAPMVDDSAVDSIAIGSGCNVGGDSCVAIGTAYAVGSASFSFANANNSATQFIGISGIGDGPNGAQGANTIVLGQGGADTGVSDSACIGGVRNAIMGNTSTSSIFGGQQNVIYADPATEQTFESVILGGNTNYIQKGESDTILGGAINSLTASFGNNLLVGSFNIMDHCNDSVLLGALNTARSVANVIGMNGAQITNNSAVVQGFSTGSVNASPQQGQYLIYKEDIVNAFTGILATSSTSNYSLLAIPLNAVWYFECRTMGRNQGGASMVTDFTGVVKNIDGVLTLTDTTKTILVQDDASWDINCSIDATRLELNFTFTSGVTPYTRWMGTVKTTEMLGTLFGPF